LRTNKNVAAFMQKSKLLSPLLLDPELSRKFMNTQVKNDLGMDFTEFVEFMQENSDDATVVEDMKQVEQEEQEEQNEDAKKTENNVVFNGSPITANDTPSASSGIGALIRRIFKMIDINNTSTIVKREFLMSLKAVPDIKDFVHKLPKIDQLFSSKEFLTGFKQLSDPCTCSEFVELGIKISSELNEIPSTNKRVQRMTSDEIGQLRKVIEGAIGEKTVSQSKLARLLLSAKVSEQLISASPALESLLKPRTFRQALSKLDTDDDKSITSEEVVQFCVNYVGV
jgi:hypothetical protein